MQVTALTVSDLNEYVRRSLAGDPMLRSITVRGEISNFKAYASGHWYFSLKDEGSRISCVMFRQHNMGLRFQPREGGKVVLTGSAGLYVASGSYQFYAEHMQEDGVGDLFARFTALRDRLLKEGLFDAARKRPLPLLPRTVGIITSQSGAVVHDIITVTRRRFPNMPLILRPAQVQGEGAAQDLARALNELAAVDTVDVIIIGRGGGSMEDLWAFNEEEVVRAIAACAKPVISAVGHETDTTLADFAADMRAPTPSAAAELAVPDKREMRQRLGGYERAMYASTRYNLDVQRQAVARKTARLQARQPDYVLAENRHRMEQLWERLVRQGDAALESLRARVLLLSTGVRAMGPGETLRRGYAAAVSEGRAITGIAQLPQRFELVFHDGRAAVQTLSVRKGEMYAEQNEPQL